MVHPHQPLAQALQVLLEIEYDLKRHCADASRRVGTPTRPLDVAIQEVTVARAEVGSLLASLLSRGEDVRIGLADDEVVVETASDAAQRGSTPVVAAPSTPSSACADAGGKEGLSSASLAKLAQHFSGFGSGASADRSSSSSVSSKTGVPAHPLARVPRPEAVSSLAELRRWTLRFERAIDKRETWLLLPKTRQQRLVAFLTALGRSLQDLSLDGSYTFRERLTQGFHKLTAFSNTERPGFVHGLALAHRPKRGSWLADAQYHWDQQFGGPRRSTKGQTIQRVLEAIAEEPSDDALCEMLARVLSAGIASDDTQLVAALAPRLSALHGRTEPGLRTLKNHVKAHLAECVAQDDDEDATHPTPDDWAWSGFTRGLRVLALGGDERGDVAERWKRELGFDSVVWDTSWNIRRIQSNAQRVRRGQYDLVVIIRSFVKHQATDAMVPACKDVDVPFVLVDSGYGAHQLRLAIERMLPDRSE